MSWSTRACCLLGPTLTAALLALTAAATQPRLPPPRKDPTPGKVTPKLEPVAETRLIMEGLAHPNFRGIERLLTQKPEGTEPWTFMRGQALLIAETGNLLMLRPPRNQGQATWFARAADLRNAARDLAESAATRDFERSRAKLVRLANACNRCHQSFRVAVDIAPFAEPGGEKKKQP
jgi:hypothetical protein